MFKMSMLICCALRWVSGFWYEKSPTVLLVGDMLELRFRRFAGVGIVIWLAVEEVAFCVATREIWHPVTFFWCSCLGGCSDVLIGLLIGVIEIDVARLTKVRIVSCLCRLRILSGSLRGLLRRLCGVADVSVAVVCWVVDSVVVVVAAAASVAVVAF